jgi:hypothetical protein
MSRGDTIPTEDTPPDAVRPGAREIDMATIHRGIHHGQLFMPAFIGRTYDRTVPMGSDLHKHLACRADPHMRQTQL